LRHAERERRGRAENEEVEKKKQRGQDTIVAACLRRTGTCSGCGCFGFYNL